MQEALQLATRKLAREPRKPFLLDAQIVQKALRHLARLGQRPLHTHARIDGRLGMLQDQLDRARSAPRQRHAVHQDLSGLRPLVTGEQCRQSVVLPKPEGALKATRSPGPTAKSKSRYSGSRAPGCA